MGNKVIAILKEYEDNGYCALKIKGDVSSKVAVYKTTLERARTPKGVNTTFEEKEGYETPVALFPFSDRGWLNAIAFIDHMGYVHTIMGDLKLK